MAKLYFEIKEKVDSGVYGTDPETNLPWTMGRFMMFRCKMSDEFLLDMMKHHQLALTSEDNRKAEEAKNQHVAERRAAAEKRRDDYRAEQEALREVNGCKGDSPLPSGLGDIINDIRGTVEDLEELRTSFRQFGWVPHFPAIRDETGLVLVGHRRLKVAEDLKIEPVYQDIVLGQGTDADVERLKIALVSNVGFAPLSAKRRQRISARLREMGWTQAKIGKALRVTQKTISEDLSHYTSGIKPDGPPKVGPLGGTLVDTLGRKRSPGRPRIVAKAKPDNGKQRKPRKQGPMKKTDLVRAEIRADVEAGVSLGKPDVLAEELSRKLGTKIDHLTVQSAENWERGRLEGMDEMMRTMLHKEISGSPSEHVCVCGVCGKTMGKS